MTGSHIDQGLVNGIVEFVLHEHPIDIEKLRRSLHHQVIIELILAAYRSWIYNYLCNQSLSINLHQLHLTTCENSIANTHCRTMIIPVIDQLTVYIVKFKV
jgi:hypothetical protein